MTVIAPTNLNSPALRALWTEAFGDTEDFLDVFWQTAFSEERSRCVMLDGNVAAALYWFDCEYNGEKIAYIYAVATAKKYRGMGLCRALMTDTHRHLEKLGYIGAILVPGESELFGFYERMGYRTCCYIDEFVSSASYEKASLSCIDGSEYARLRRKLLPEGAVLQEKESILFLDRMAEFYTGEDYILAVDGDFIIEYLGDKSKLPNALGTLDIKKATVRTPGKEIPFAMYISFGAKLPPPSYFGFAFD